MSRIRIGVQLHPQHTSYADFADAVRRVEDLGVGISLKKLNVSVFSRALWEATHSERMIVKAKVLGEEIRSVSLPFPITTKNPPI